MRILISVFTKLNPSLISLRSKSAKGCDLWTVGDAVKVFPFCVEAKAVKRLNIFKAFKQAVYNTYSGMLPLVLAKSDEKSSKYSDHIATLRLVDFFVLIELLNKYNKNWYEDFKQIVPVFENVMPPFSDSKEKFNSKDLQRIWENTQVCKKNGEQHV